MAPHYSSNQNPGPPQGPLGPNWAPLPGVSIPLKGTHWWPPGLPAGSPGDGVLATPGPSRPHPGCSKTWSRHTEVGEEADPQGTGSWYQGSWYSGTFHPCKVGPAPGDKPAQASGLSESRHRTAPADMVLGIPIPTLREEADQSSQLHPQSLLSGRAAPHPLPDIKAR